MSPDRYHLHRIESEIRWIKKMVAEMELNGLIDRLPTYGTLTNRQRMEKDLVRCENLKKHYEEKIRHDRIMSKWHLRKLNRAPLSRSSRRAPAQTSSWFQPMSIDDILQDRQIIDNG